MAAVPTSARRPMSWVWQAKTVLDRSTALHYAAMRSKPLALVALLDHGADVHARAQGGNTALHQVRGCAMASTSVSHAAALCSDNGAS
jgi:hypothetical protein